MRLQPTVPICSTADQLHCKSITTQSSITKFGGLGMGPIQACDFLPVLNIVHIYKYMFKVMLCGTNVIFKMTHDRPLIVSPSAL